MTSIDIDTAIIERSHMLPVLVDFWATWCGPCRVLGPVLEELAGAAAGRWELVKVDTDAQPEAAEAFGIMGIPAVKLFHRGRIVAEFTGALPREDVARWLDENLPDDRLDLLETLTARWASEGAGIRAELERFVREHPDLPAARLRLAQVLAPSEPARARELLVSVRPGVDQMELAEDAGSLVTLCEGTPDAPADVAPPLDAARAGLRDHDLAAALAALVEAVRVDRRFGDDLARRSAVAIFHLLGRDHDLTDTYQRQLGMALHS